MIDQYGRMIDYIRISITDRCNLRCVYCMPPYGVQSIQHSDVLRFEEILRVVRLLTNLGIRHIRLTGGEPTVRKGYLDLISLIHALPGVETVSMTTNGLLLKGMVKQAKDAGLKEMNISLDTLCPETYQTITRGGNVNDVFSVISDALEQGIKIKINAVPIRGLNENDLVDLALLAKNHPLYVRFIELMPVGCGSQLERISSDETMAMMESHFGTLYPDSDKHGFGPAQYVKPKDFIGSIGFISPMSHEFCDRCNRIRLTSDGLLKLCLNHQSGLDLREILRSGKSDNEILSLLSDAIIQKPRNHGFADRISDREIRRMNEIGG